MDYISFGLIGLGGGALIAVCAMGLVVTYKGTGFINFAIGAMAAWGVYIYDELRRTGDLILPVVGLPDRVNVSAPMSFLPAFVVGVVVVVVLGLLAHVLVFRSLRNAPALAKVVASVGVMLFLQALLILKFGSDARVAPAVLPTDWVEAGGLSVPSDRLILAGIAVVFAVLVGAYFKFTRLGWATRAAAENQRSAALARLSPQFLAGTTWVIAGAMTSAMAILSAQTGSLQPINYTLLVVPALAAALLGQFTSLGVACFAGLSIVALQAELTFLQTKSWFPDWAGVGLTDAVPFVIVIVALYLIGPNLPGRGGVKADPLPEVGRPTLRPGVILLAVGVGVAALVLTEGSTRFGVVTSMIISIIALSLVVLTGFVGQISLAQAAIAGASGFFVAKIGTGLPFPLSMLAAASFAAIVGVIIGIPALRLRGIQLAVVTLAGAVAVERFVFRNPAITGARETIPDPELFGLNLAVREGRILTRLEFGLMVLMVLLLVVLAVVNLARSGTGRRFLAVRSNERAAASVGVSLFVTKTVAFAISSFIAGLGGALIGYSRGQLSPASFTVFVGLSFLVFAYIGGITRISGALIAGLFAPLGILYVILDRLLDNLGDLDEYYLLLSGLAVIMVSIVNPSGIAGRIVPRVTAALRERLPATALSTAPERGGADHVVRPEHHVGTNSGLEVSDLGIRYGGVVAVDRVSLGVPGGSIVGLIGPNGGGKTSLINGVSGFAAATGGVEVDGRRIDADAPHVRTQHGLIRTWQSIELFDDLTVGENCQVAAEHGSFATALLDCVRPGRTAESDEVERALSLMGLSQLSHERPASLSRGLRNRVGVARALAGDPKVLLLDEPAAGLDTAETTAFGACLRDVAATGVGVLLVDHDMGLILDVCDFVYVLDFGRIIASGTPEEVRDDPIVIKAYLGGNAREPEVTGDLTGSDSPRPARAGEMEPT
mgnify:FL=1